MWETQAWRTGQLGKGTEAEGRERMQHFWENEFIEKEMNLSEG